MAKTPAKDGIPHVREGSEAHFQTEPKRRGHYMSSRWNACGWQTRREDFMVCLGTSCRYRFCDIPDKKLPPRGAPCQWELGYAGEMLTEFEKIFNPKTIGPYLEEDYAKTRWEWMVAYLLANRAAIRMSRAVEEIEYAMTHRVNGVIDRKPFEHHALAMRYLAAAHNRIQTILELVPVYCDMEIAKRREARVLTKMIEHGYWHPARGTSPPAIEDAPEWIVKLVDES